MVIMTKRFVEEDSNLFDDIGSFLRSERTASDIMSQIDNSPRYGEGVSIDDFNIRYPVIGSKDYRKSHTDGTSYKESTIDIPDTYVDEPVLNFVDDEYQPTRKLSTRHPTGNELGMPRYVTNGLRKAVDTDGPVETSISSGDYNPRNRNFNIGMYNPETDTAQVYLYFPDGSLLTEGDIEFTSIHENGHRLYGDDHGKVMMHEYDGMVKLGEVEKLLRVWSWRAAFAFAGEDTDDAAMYWDAKRSFEKGTVYETLLNYAESMGQEILDSGKYDAYLDLEDGIFKDDDLRDFDNKVVKMNV